MSSGRVRERAGDDKWVVGREREKSGLNDVGPKPTKQVQPVRPVAPTGQTGLAQTDRTTWFGELSQKLELMAEINS